MGRDKKEHGMFETFSHMFETFSHMLKSLAKVHISLELSSTVVSSCVELCQLRTIEIRVLNEIRITQ